MKALELQNICIDHYCLGAHLCRTVYTKSGVVIYTLNTVSLTPINLSKFCTEKDIEIFAVKIEVHTSELCILTVYRSPTGNFNSFLEIIDAALQSVYSPSLAVIICGDININYLETNEQRKQ